MDTATQRILLVEDGDGDAALIMEYLRGRNYRIDRCDRLAIAIQWLIERRYDAILLDLGLPDSAGIQTLFQIQQHAGEAHIVVVTGRIDAELGESIRAVGADMVLPKHYIDDQTLPRALERLAVPNGRLLLQTREELATLTATVVADTKTMKSDIAELKSDRKQMIWLLIGALIGIIANLIVALV